MHRFQELKKRCRRYYFKRMALFLIMFGVVAGAGFYWQNIEKEQTKKLAAAISLKPSKKQQSVGEKKAKFYALQVGAYNIDAQSLIASAKKRLKRLGIEDCYVVKNPQKELAYLRCGCAQRKEGLQNYRAMLEKEHMGYLVIRTNCVQKRKSAVLQPIKPKKKMRRSEENETEPASTGTVLVVKEKRAGVDGLQKLFAKRPTYDLALKIAMKFYEQKAYDKAIEWAKKANKIDSSKAQAWIVYARSLYEKGNKKEAIEVLRFFLNFKTDPRVEELLRKWR